MTNLMQKRRKDYYYRLGRKQRAGVWVRSDMGISLNAGNVSAWGDQSGFKRHLLQATASKQPPYTRTGGAADRAYVGTFDNVDDFLRVTYSYLQPETRFFVVLPTVGGTSAAVADGGAGNSAQFFAANAVLIGAFAGAQLLASATTSAWGGFQVTFNAANSVLRVGHDAPVLGNLGPGGLGGLIVGLFGDQMSNPADARIAEVTNLFRIATTTEVMQQRVYRRGYYRLS